MRTSTRLGLVGTLMLGMLTLPGCLTSQKHTNQLPPTTAPDIGTATSPYTTNATIDISEGSFDSNRDVKVEHALVHFPTGDQIFGNPESNYKITLLEGSKKGETIELDETLPLWAMHWERAAPWMNRPENPEEKRIYDFTTLDGKRTVYVPMEWLNSDWDNQKNFVRRLDIKTEEPVARGGKVVQYAGPIRFRIEEIDFHREGFRHMPFASVRLDGENQLRMALVKNPIYMGEPGTNNLLILGERTYIEAMARFDLLDGKESSLTGELGTVDTRINTYKLPGFSQGTTKPNETPYVLPGISPWIARPN